MAFPQFVIIWMLLYSSLFKNYETHFVATYQAIIGHIVCSHFLRGREFDPGPVPYFRGDLLWNNFYGHSPHSTDSFKKGCCQLQAKVCAQITGKPLVQACPGKSVVRWTDRPAMTIAVDLGRKATKTNTQTPLLPNDYHKSVDWLFLGFQSVLSKYI